MPNKQVKDWVAEKDSSGRSRDRQLKDRKCPSCVSVPNFVRISISIRIAVVVGALAFVFASEILAWNEHQHLFITQTNTHT